MTPNSNYLKCPSTENGQMNCNIFMWWHSTELNKTKWNKRTELSKYIMLWLCLWSIRWREENSHKVECATGLHWESPEQTKTPSWWKKILLWCNSCFCKLLCGEGHQAAPKVGLQGGWKEIMKSISGMMKTYFMLLRLWALCVCMLWYRY